MNKPLKVVIAALLLSSSFALQANSPESAKAETNTQGPEVIETVTKHPVFWCEPV